MLAAIRHGCGHRQTQAAALYPVALTRQLSKNCVCVDTNAPSATSAPSGCTNAPRQGPPVDRNLHIDIQVRRDFGYPAKYHAGSFPWLLSAERQRTPVEDFGSHAGNIHQPAVDIAAQFLPQAARQRLAHALNMRIARAALGPAAVDDICAGAAAVLPRVASLLSRASSGDTAATGELEHVFTHPLLSRYTRDLERLRNDHVQLALEVHSVDSARVHQVRTQTGPAAAFAALDGAAQVSSLRAGLTRQTHRYTSLLGATHAAPRCEPAASWASAVRDATSGQSPVRVRVDVELKVNMRYRLIGWHCDESRVIVDDDSTRNLMLTLESSVVDQISSDAQPPAFEWRVADIDYLLSSERRIENEFIDAKEAPVVTRQ
ncbi:hypothetical protein GGF46_003718 [Coemansia sp. RSA 552]|nr:hypothetical protein GGF46_003718 [Coemansia sp. RSA 552]